MCTELRWSSLMGHIIIVCIGQMYLCLYMNNVIFNDGALDGDGKQGSYFTFNESVSNSLVSGGGGAGHKPG